MENFTHSINDDFSDYNGNREMNGSSNAERNGERETSPKTTASEMTDLDIDAILNRAPIRLTRRSRPLEEAAEFVQRLSAFVEARAGEDVVLTCQWRAFPLPSVKWYRDDEDITDSTNARHKRESEVDGTETLYVKSVGKKDEGAYKCRVENQEGVAATTGYLSVSGDVAEKTLSSQQKGKKLDHVISSAPHLRTIVEQKSVEEREGEQTKEQEPSPIQTFIDNFRREKTWPMYGTGYGMDEDALSTGSADSASLSSLSSELMSDPFSEDADQDNYDSVSWTARTHGDDGDAHNPSGGGDCNSSLGVEEMIRAPSIEDIMGELQAAEGEDLKLKCQQEYDSEEDSCRTPTNFLDEPDFTGEGEGNKEKGEVMERNETPMTPGTPDTPTMSQTPILTVQKSTTADNVTTSNQTVTSNTTSDLPPNSVALTSPIKDSTSTPSISTPVATAATVQTLPNNVTQVPAQVPLESAAAGDKKRLVRVQNIDANEPVIDPKAYIIQKEVSPETKIEPQESPVLKIEKQESPVLRKESKKSPKSKRVSRVLNIDLWEIPHALSRVLAEQLELPWIYYFLCCWCFASFAAATHMPVPYFVMCVAIITLISIRCLCPNLV